MKRGKARFLKDVGPVEGFEHYPGTGEALAVSEGAGQVGVWVLWQNRTGVCACIGSSVYAWVCVCTFMGGNVRACGSQSCCRSPDRCGQKPGTNSGVRDASPGEGDVSSLDL